MKLSKKFIIVLLFSVLFSLNLSLTDFHDPQAHHILDAEVYRNTLIISAMVQGIEFYNITSNGEINHQDHFTLGQGTKANCVEAINNYAYFTSSNGLYVVNISNSSNPQNLGQVNGSNGFILENLDAETNLLAVAAHEDGVLLYDISNPNNLTLLSTIPTENSWGVRLQNGYAYVSDNQDVKIYDVSNPVNVSYVNMVETSNAVKDIALIDEFMYVAIGSDGVNIYGLSNPESPNFLGNFNTNTMANRISPFDGKLAVSDWPFQIGSFRLAMVLYNDTLLQHFCKSYKNNVQFFVEIKLAHDYQNKLILCNLCNKRTKHRLVRRGKVGR